MCTQCEALMINGIYCHEHGCPIAWKDYKRECKWCGAMFKPDYEGQQTCGIDCQIAYNN